MLMINKMINKIITPITYKGERVPLKWKMNKDQEKVKRLSGELEVEKTTVNCRNSRSPPRCF